MDKKLTKEDIINVAKCCITGNCESCSLVENDEKCTTNFLNWIIEYMENEPAPTADVQEVKHGEWKPIFMIVAYEHAGKTFDLRGIKCSECGEEMIYELKESFQPKPNYCPNCGARMDGGSNDG